MTTKSRRLFMAFGLLMAALPIAMTMLSSPRQREQKLINDRIGSFLSDDLERVEAIVGDDHIYVGLSPGTTITVPLALWRRIEPQFAPAITLGRSSARELSSGLMTIRLRNRRGDTLEIQILFGGQGGMLFRIGDVVCTRDNRRQRQDLAVDESAVVVLILASCDPDSPEYLIEDIDYHIALLGLK